MVEIKAQRLVITGGVCLSLLILIKYYCDLISGLMMNLEGG